jgi:hypothetical protein
MVQLLRLTQQAKFEDNVLASVPPPITFYSKGVEKL